MGRILKEEGTDNLLFHALKEKEIFSRLDTAPQGLSKEEAEQRLHKYGLNEIKEEKKISPWSIFLEQFKSPLIWLLLVATAISLLIGEFVDAAVIGIIVVLNAALGFFQEYKAEKAIEALRKMSSLKAKVIREGREIIIDAVNLVPGDILLLETGDKVPADARLFEVHDLDTQEAPLTGESSPVKKSTAHLPEKTIVADRADMVYSGTIITNGRAKAVVCATGMQTEFGRIASLIEEAKEKLTPLQKKLRLLGKYITYAVVAIAVIIFFVGILTGKTASLMFIIAIALAVAAIPEGLPAVVTISLAIGVQRMVKRNALVRKLPSVETLGVVNVICSDKTGTLTHNQMTVTHIWANNLVYNVTGSGYGKKGIFTLDNKLADHASLELLLRCGALCNDAHLEEKKGKVEVFGDPTEAALVVSAEKAGYSHTQLNKKFPRTDEITFSSERKRMTTVHKFGSKKISFTKGAPDVIIGLCDRIIIDGKIERMTRDRRAAILKKNEEFADQALRVLGFAYNDQSKNPEKNMIFIGLQAMIDPPREEAKEAIKRCQEAGIRVIMITGDHASTALAIARQLGLEGEALTGEDLERKDLSKIIHQISIFARVNPEHKIKIVETLKRKRYIVAMTGDGVNDAPALKKADIGISMGITGTDVAKEASDMILTDDNFTSIVNAVEEGRNIFDNIKKFVIYLLSSNASEVMVIFLAMILGFPLPLIAVQILWINLVTDGAPAAALGVEPPEPNLMSRPPRKSRTGIISRYNVVWIIIIGLVMMLGTLGVFYYALKTSGWGGGMIDLDNPPYYYLYATSLAFTTLMMFQMFNVINCKTLKESVFKAGIFSNRWLIAAIILSVLLQLMIIYTPYFNKIFNTVPLTIADWVIVILVSSAALWVGEIIKLIKREEDNHAH